MLKVKSIYEQLEHCTNDLERVELLAELSTEFLNSDIKRCTEVVEELGELAKNTGNPTALGYYYSGLGRLQYKQSKFADAGIAFKIAIDYAIAAEDGKLESNCYHSLGMIYWKEGNLKESLEVSLKALEFFTASKEPNSNQAYCYNSVGNVYERLGQYEKAEEAYLHGWKILKTLGADDRALYNVMGNLGVIKLRRKEFAEALQYLEPVYTGFKTLQHTTGEILTLVHIGQSYVGLRQYAKGMRYYLQALKLLKTNDFKFAEADVYRGLGHIYMAMDGYEEALKHFEKGMEIVKAIDYHAAICDFYVEFALAHYALGNLDAALESVDKGLTLAIAHKLPVETQNLEETKDRLLSEKSQVA